MNLWEKLKNYLAFPASVAKYVEYKEELLDSRVNMLEADIEYLEKKVEKLEKEKKEIKNGRETQSTNYRITFPTPEGGSVKAPTKASNRKPRNTRNSSCVSMRPARVRKSKSQ